MTEQKAEKAVRLRSWVSVSAAARSPSQTRSQLVSSYVVVLRNGKTATGNELATSAECDPFRLVSMFATIWISEGRIRSCGRRLRRLIEFDLVSASCTQEAQQVVE